MFCKTLIFFTLGMIIYYAPTVQAQQMQEKTAYCPDYSTVITVKIVDSHTAICRITDTEVLNLGYDSPLGKRLDILELYRRRKGKKPDFTADLTVYANGIRRITLREHKYKEDDVNCIDSCTEMA